MSLKTTRHIIASPTDDRRHISKIRFGKVSAEQFCKKPERRKELGLPPIIREVQ